MKDIEFDWAKSEEYKQKMAELFRTAPTNSMKPYLFYANFYEDYSTTSTMSEELGEFIRHNYGLYLSGDSKRITLGDNNYLIMYFQETVRPMRGNFMMGIDRRYIKVMRI